MEGFDPAARGRVSSLIFFVFRRDGERSATGNCDLQIVEEETSKESNPLDLQVDSFYDGRTVLADHAGRFQRTRLLLGGALAACPEGR